MFSYTITQWLFFFYFYSFFGWCFESAYVSIKSHRLVNRGFMRGPFLPLYGSGAIMMLLVSRPFQDNIFYVYIAGCIGATVLEYVTGVVMEALFKVRYWDYSKAKFNFQGHICLGSSLAWGGLTIFMTEFLHKPVEQFALSIPSQLLGIVVLVLTAVLCGDFALSFKAALDLRDVLIKMEKAKEEAARLQKRLDVIIALANEEMSSYRDELAQRRDEFADGLAQRREAFVDGFTERMNDLKEQVESALEQLKEQLHIKPGQHLESLIRSNPTMSSGKFKEALEELKENLNRRKKT